MSKTQRGILSLCTPLAAAAIALVVSGCAGDVVSPAARQPQQVTGPEMGRSGNDNNRSHSRYYSNRERYRNRGRGHGYGRWNDIEVEGMSVLGADRITRLTLTTGTLDPLTAGRGDITKVQVKAYSPEGSKLYTSNFNHLNPAGIQKVSLRDLTVGSLLYIRVHVRGARAHETNCGCRGRGHDDDDRGRGSSRGRDRDRDRDDSRWDRRDRGDDDDCDDDPRTDVVTLVDTVKAAAALNVDINLPPSTVVGAPTVITGTVSEVNGDVGTRADCQLWINGKLVDTAQGIWVDAGDAVSCAFTYTFTNTGNQTVEVRVSGDGGNGQNPILVADGGTVSVGSPIATAWSAEAEDRTVNNTTVLDYTWWRPDGSHKEYSNTETTATRSQTINVQGTISRAVVFPLGSITLSVASTGTTWEDESWTALASVLDALGRPCATKDIPDHGAMFFVCRGLQGGTSWGYQRFAGRVTYHSVGFSRTFDVRDNFDEYYTWNDEYTTSESGGRLRDFTGGVSLRLTITDAGGTSTFNPVIPMTPFSNQISTTARTCEETSPYWVEGGAVNTCNSASSDESGIRGRVTG